MLRVIIAAMRNLLMSLVISYERGLLIILAGFVALPALSFAYDDSYFKDAPVIAEISWPDPLNPGFAALGNDQFLLATTTGMQVWDVAKASFAEAKGWPAAARLESAWEKIAGGRLLLGSAKNDQGAHLHTVAWWDPASQSFTTSLQLDANDYLVKMLAIDEQHVLACIRSGVGKRGVDFNTLPVKIVLLVVKGNKLQLSHEQLPTMRAALLAAGVRGIVPGIGRLEPALGSTVLPVTFNAQSCRMEITNMPADMAEGSLLGFKHQILPNGQVIISHADWHSNVLGYRANLDALLLWNSSTASWQTLSNKAERGNHPGAFINYGVRDSVVSVASSSYAGFIEFFDPVRMRWTRSQERLLGDHSPLVAPLMNGDVLAVSKDGGKIMRFSPMRLAEPGKFAFWHGKNAHLVMAGGGLMLFNGDWQNRPEMVQLQQRAIAKQIAPLPVVIDYLSGVELHDGSVLVFGGLPNTCGPGSNRYGCTTIKPQPSFRYLRQQDKWEEVPGLLLQFAQAPLGASHSGNGWARNDSIVRHDGDFVYLGGESYDDPPRKDSDWKPLLTTAMRWNLQSGLRKMANLRKGRINANLLELDDHRLVVIGGRAQQELVALEKECPTCEDEFISVGMLDWARTTEIYDDKSAVWSVGPLANYAGGRAVKLRNGKLFKFGVSGYFAAPVTYVAELADANFAWWDKLPAFPLRNFNLDEMFVLGNQILLTSTEGSGKEQRAGKVVVWDDDKHQWLVWENWLKKEAWSILAVPPKDSDIITAKKQVLLRYERSYELKELPD